MSKSMIFFILTILVVTFIVSDASDCKCPDRRRFRKGPQVCGTDGVTYESKRALKCHNKCQGTIVTVYSYQPCPCRCGSTLEYVPVCGSNGKTYPNEETVKCNNKCYDSKVDIVGTGPCNPNEETEGTSY